jgi:hypothetical protein
VNALAKRVEIESQKQLRELLREHFLDLDRAAHDTDRKVAWCTSVGPCEILTAFGFEVYFPENHGATRGPGLVMLVPRAVGLGYSASPTCDQPADPRRASR